MYAQYTRHRRATSRGFTLTELLVVVGLIALLIALLMPAMGKARAAANATACLSNIRQMGVAWLMYSAENKGHLIENVWATPSTPDVGWRGYWPGVLDGYQVRGDALLCPAAERPIPFNYNNGFGNVRYAWTGTYESAATPVKFTATNYRDGSYGFNQYLIARGGFDIAGIATNITKIKPTHEVPVFADAIYWKFSPKNFSSFSVPVVAPPNLRGADFSPSDASNYEHWRFLIARHGRAINICFADGSASRVPLEETYLLRWKEDWIGYRLQLPTF